MSLRDKNGIDVSIILPVLNEEQTLPFCIDNAGQALAELGKLDLSGEIIVCDNNSSDRSAEVAGELGARVITCLERGYGRALISGCEAARGSMIVMGDADGSYDFVESIPMVEALLKGDDLCIGNRFRGGIMPGAMPPLNKYLGNPLLTGLLNLLFRTKLGDAHCGLRAFTKKAFGELRLRAKGMEFASEMIVKAALLGLICTEVPVTLRKDLRDKPPHLKPWRDGWRHFKFLMLSSPLWLFFIPSMLMIAFSTFVFTARMLTDRSAVFTIGNFWLGDHWLILAGGLFTIGWNGITLGLAALINSVNQGYRRPPKFLLRIYRLAGAETGLALGGIFLAGGFAALLYVFLSWTANSYGPMMKIREMVLATTFIVVGIQTVFSGFFLSSFKDTEANKSDE
jgi:glycosyltransferase involved in cell wall biosynthesis